MTQLFNNNNNRSKKKINSKNRNIMIFLLINIKKHNHADYKTNHKVIFFKKKIRNKYLEFKVKI